VLAHTAGAEGARDRNDAPGRAGPPVHVSEFGRYTLRANVVRSEVLSASTAKRHGIERASDRAVLNLVILERQGKRQVTLPARVTASTHNLIGQSEAIEMRAIKANGRVSYVGTFGFAPLRNFRITMTQLPVGTNEQLEIEFEDRLVVTGQ